MTPGQCEFSLVRDSEAALTTGQWCGAAPQAPAPSSTLPPAVSSSLPGAPHAASIPIPPHARLTPRPCAPRPVPPTRRMLPGADGAFVGSQDDLAVVLSNSGRSVSVYETAKLTGAAAKPLYSAELKEGLMAAVYPGGLVLGLRVCVCVWGRGVRAESLLGGRGAAGARRAVKKKRLCPTQTGLHLPPPPAQARRPTSRRRRRPGRLPPPREPTSGTARTRMLGRTTRRLPPARSGRRASGAAWSRPVSCCCARRATSEFGKARACRDRGTA